MNGSSIHRKGTGCQRLYPENANKSAKYSKGLYDCNDCKDTSGPDHHYRYEMVV